jgi:hypothetical protein
MIPTRGQVKQRFRALLDDPAGAVFTDDIFSEAFGEAYDALFNAFLNAQCPRIQVITTYVLPANTTSLTPAQAGIVDMADPDELKERTAGSNEKFLPVDWVDELPQRDPVDRLLDFTWRFDTFYFIGATTARELQITYESSGIAPQNDSDSINVDGCLTFLAKAAAAAAGPLKGYDSIAAQYRLDAYGPKYSLGMIGGELFRIVQPRVRSMQHVPLARMPYSVAQRIGLRRRTPYIQAQQPAGKGPGTPVQFSSASGTITGVINGINDTFYLSYPVSTAVIYVQGVLQTQGVNCTFGANQIKFLPGSIPQPGSVITAEGWV